MSEVERCREYERRVMALIEAPDDRQRQLDADRLYSELRSGGHVPLTCGTRACFLYNGKADSVAIAGDWTHWQIAMPLNRIRGTDLFYEIVEFPIDARLQYKLVVDDEWIVDPGNARRVEEGFGINSEFWMPGHHDPSQLWHEKEDVRSGTVERHSLRSRYFGHREFYLYTPAAAINSSSQVPLLVIHDGEEALRLGRFSVILDNLIAQQRIIPCAALFLPPHNRSAEYMFDNSYLEFSVDEILPAALGIWEGSAIPITTTPRRRAVLGASLGGLLALWTVTQYSNVVATCIAQSPALWPQRGRIFKRVQEADMSDSQIIIQTGTIGDAHELAHIMAARLRTLDVPVTYMEYNQGHTWGNWRSTFADAIRAWIGISSVG